MKESFFTFNRFHYLFFYFILFSSFFLFAGLECNNEENEPEDPFKADFTVKPENGTVDTIFKFDPSESVSTVKNPINKYYWDFNNNGNPDVSTDDDRIVIHQFTEEGIYPVKLIVTTPYDVKDSMTKSVSVAGADNCFDDFHALCPDQPTVTLAGRAYKTVKIGDQCWFAENLNFGIMVKYNETEQTDNATVEKYCYDDDPANCEKYGGIYTWHEMMDYKDTPGTIGICPVGWHIPTQADWDELANALGGYAGAGRKMMSCENDAWTIEDLATNGSGFTAYPGGRFWVGDFDWIGWQTNFWTSEFSTLYNSEKAFYRSLSREKEELIGFGTGEGGEPWLWQKWWGAYVRCVKDK